MRKTSLILLVVTLLSLIITTLSGCTEMDTTNDYETETTSNYYQEDADETKIQEDNQSVISPYYSVLKEEGKGLIFDLTIEEFLNNYNSLKTPYEDYDYKDISFEDFFYIESGTNYNGTGVEVYGCNLSIMGRNNDICIIISKNNNDNITALNLGVQNYNLYTGDYRTKILLQYKLLIQSLGVSETTVQAYINEMGNNLQSYNIFATYDKGLALYLDTSNPQADYYRICPYTFEQWESASGLNQISIR